MRRREFITGAGTFIPASSFPEVLWAQPQSKRRVAVLWTTSKEAAAPYLDTITAELRRYGYEPGVSLDLTNSFAAGSPTALSALAAEIVQSSPDLIITGFNAAAVELRKLTTTIPIIVNISVEPVGAGLADSIARPGRNVTGNVSAGPEIMGKRLQLVLDVVPSLNILGVIGNRAVPGIGLHYNALVEAAARIGIAVVDGQLSSPEDLGTAFQALADSRVEGVVGLTADSLIFLLPHRISEWAIQHRAPLLFLDKEFCRAKALMCYSPPLETFFQNSVKLADKILKGTPAGELPFEQSTRYELSVNVATAKALGITMPASLLATADHLFE